MVVLLKCVWLGQRGLEVLDTEETTVGWFSPTGVGHDFKNSLDVDTEWTTAENETSSTLF